MKKVLVTLIIFFFMAFALFRLRTQVAEIIVQNFLKDKKWHIDFNIDELSMNELSLSKIKIGKRTSVEALKIQFSTEPFFHILKSEIRVNSYDFNELKKIFNDSKKDLKSKSSPSMTNNQIDKTCAVLSNANLKLKVPETNFFLLKATCKNNQLNTEVKGLVFRNLPSFNIQIDTLLSSKDLQSTFTAKSNLMSLKGGLDYALETQNYFLSIKNSGPSVNINDIKNLVPNEYKEKFSLTSGFISFDIKAEKKEQKQTVHTNLEVDQLNLNYDGVKVKEARLRNSNIDLLNLKSEKKQRFSAKEIVVGKPISKIKIDYKIINPTHIYIDHIEFFVDKTQITAKDFEFFPDKNISSPVQIKINRLPLQELLSLGLGDEVNATGTLNGYLNIQFENKKPVISLGELVADQNGQIQYRPSHIKDPPSPDSFSTDPMELLNGYLYDFYYSDLRADLTSDNQFDMKMKLSTTGKNPNYLAAKPLKLNVNLEQNLLAALQAMMISYNLPKKLEEKISGLGE